VLRLKILDLEAADRRLWSALYLLRAASQLDDAAGALQTNSIDAADRSLLAARRSLDRAYDVGAEEAKGPIDTFRLQLGQLRDDLQLRPENLDRRLRQIRQLILSLADEGGP
jgi:biopolymer transport protein ExbB/TolQ